MKWQRSWRSWYRVRPTTSRGQPFLSTEAGRQSEPALLPALAGFVDSFPGARGNIDNRPGGGGGAY